MMSGFLSARSWRRWLFPAALMLVLACVLRASPATAQWNRTAIKQALQATVQVLVPDNNGDLYETGSGTVLDAEHGVILTNYHVVGSTEKRELYNKDSMAYIAVNPIDLKGAPILKYVAKMIAGSADDDLAVLKITGMADGPEAPLPKNLGLISVGRGNSEDLLPGDPLAVIGFPELGGSTVTFTDGVVSGFLDENHDGVYEWIKTDTEINPGNSGGLAIDQQGDFIGVPTSGYSQADVAGKISLIRPGAIALNFFDRAILGQTNDTGNAQSGSGAGRKSGAKTTPSIAVPRNTSDAAFGPITFASDITPDDIPQNVGNAFVEVKEVYGFFAVTGLNDGTTWRSRWLLDGDEVLNDNQTWTGGDTASTWLSISHPDGLPEGKYTLELYLQDKLMQSGTFTVAASGTWPAGKQPVNVTGVVHDADNARRTISGALVVFLNPGTTIDAWISAKYDDSMVFASGTSARGGVFQLDNKVTPGTAYGVIVVQDGYKPIQVDAYEIPANTGGSVRVGCGDGEGVERQMVNGLIVNER